jgi:predicted nuclease of restriction endonuclease-like RecB superfamily
LSPEIRLNYSVVGNTVVPHFLGELDHPWLRVLIEEHDRFVGRRQSELEARLRDPLPCESPARKRQQAIDVLTRLRRSHRQTSVPPRRARALVFGEAAQALLGAADAVLSRVAASLGVGVAELRDSLFADLPGERLVAAPIGGLSPHELALRANLALAQALLVRATSVRIEAVGTTRALVRHAKFKGLICTVASHSGATAPVLDLSGPFALFRHTRLYGRALGELLPLLAWCARFRLHADCMLQGRRLMLELATGDPIFPAAEPRRYDSRLEERFAREFRSLAPDWDLLREPEPVTAGRTLVFPDFALVHRHDSGRRWLVEIVGFWTPDYVARKLALYRSASLPNLILCIDEERNCAMEDLPAGALVVRFRRRIDASAVLRLVASDTSVAAHVGVAHPPAAEENGIGDDRHGVGRMPQRSVDHGD